MPSPNPPRPSKPRAADPGSAPPRPAPRRRVEEFPEEPMEDVDTGWNRPEDDDEYYEDEPEGRGVWFFFMAVVLSLGFVGGGFYALKVVTERGYLDQYAYVFQDVSLLPNKNIRPSPMEASIQIFESDDGVTLTPRLQRLRRNAMGHEKDLLVLAAMFSGERPAGFKSLLPEGTKSRGFYRLGRTAYLDLTENFLKPASPTPRGERLAVYSLVNSIILNNQDVDAVQLLVEGKPIEIAWGWLDCSSPLGPDLSLIR
ncbi:GerMN domain-containing protein [Candidatus Sumerlaeota bacterium]|nr:GerMN domain-containing protein [Candidatus Sumerlaeota bacterium]